MPHVGSLLCWEETCRIFAGSSTTAWTSTTDWHLCYKIIVPSLFKHNPINFYIISLTIILKIWLLHYCASDFSVVGCSNPLLSIIWCQLEFKEFTVGPTVTLNYQGQEL